MGLDGLEVARRLRSGGETPILMLTAKDTVSDKVKGFDSGADDYLVKPFAFEELLARIETTIKYLEGFKESDFEEGKVQEEVVIKLPGMQIKFKPFEYVYKLAHANMW